MNNTKSENLLSFEKKLLIRGLPDNWFFPTTRYRGSKRKILNWIWENVKDLDFSTVLDGFGGTSVVSLLFKRMNKTVTYNDYLQFNYQTGVAFIKNHNFILSDLDINFILNNLSKNSPNGFKFNNYPNKFFLDEENEFLDHAIANIISLDSIYKGDELEYKRSIAYWALGQSCLFKRPFNLFHRNNLYIRTNNVERTFGNKTSWETPFPLLFIRFCREANKIVFDNGKTNKSICSDLFEIENNNYDLVYFDPPYFFNNSNDNDYYSLYHFLESVVNYQKMLSRMDVNENPKDFNSAPMSWPRSKAGIYLFYNNLINKYNKSIIVFSLKSGGFVNVNDIEHFLINNGKEVYKVSREYKYALNKQNGNSEFNREWLIIGK